MATILIVDDNRMKREALAMVLAQEGHAVTKAGDGVEGLAQARALHPDLVIADLIMPRMDGYDFCKALRADPQLASIPIVLNSILDDAKVYVLMRECKLRFFIPVGAKKKEIIGIIRAALAGHAVLPPPSLEEFTGRIDDVLAELKALSAKLPSG